MVQVFKVLSAALIVWCLQGAGALSGEHALKRSTWAAWNAGFAPRFPGKTWQQFATPEDAGWSSKELAKVRALSDRLGSSAVMIVQDGVIVAEWGEVERRFLNHSIRKSLLSALIGIAVERGELSLSERLADLQIDEDTPLTAEEKTATVADLLKSRSGVFLPAAYETEDMRARRPQRGSHKPGRFWFYNNWDFNALGTIYNRKTDGNLFKAFKAQIADPIGMQDFDLRHTHYHLEAQHSRHPAYPFRMSARDLARFGLLYLNEGTWKDTPIVPAGWVRESTASYSRSERVWRGYGYMWWRYLGELADLGAYEASGAGGHRIIVLPGARLVVVHRVNTYAGKRVSGGRVRRLLKAIVRARTGPVRPNAKIADRVQSPGAEDIPPSEAEMKALLGRYESPRFQMQIKRRAGGLKGVVGSHGTFQLLKRGPRAYVIEDMQFRLSFDGDGDARAASLTVTFPHDEPAKLTRKP
ncbi:MAG: serine hydrolase [Pseudomonadota bacterium]